MKHYLLDENDKQMVMSLYEQLGSKLETVFSSTLIPEPKELEQDCLDSRTYHNLENLF